MYLHLWLWFCSWGQVMKYLARLERCILSKCDVVCLCEHLSPHVRLCAGPPRLFAWPIWLARRGWLAPPKKLLTGRRRATLYVHVLAAPNLITLSLAVASLRQVRIYLIKYLFIDARPPARENKLTRIFAAAPPTRRYWSVKARSDIWCFLAPHYQTFTCTAFVRVHF